MRKLLPVLHYILFSIFALIFSNCSTKEDQVVDTSTMIKEVGIENELFDNFNLNASRLGWINCDVFLRIDKPLVDMVVDAPADKTVMKLIFNNYKTTVSGVLKNNGKVYFYGLPEGEAVKIITVYPDHSKTFLSVTELMVKQSVADLSPFKAVSREVLEAELKKIF